MTLGIAANPWAMNVPNALTRAAERVGIPVRVIDLATVRVGMSPAGGTTVTDRSGPVDIDALAPYLLFGFPAAVPAIRVLLRTAKAQNPMDGVLVADDKAATAERLSAVGIRQVRTEVCGLELAQARLVADEVGYPVVLKRTHGAQGRWVRRASDPDSLAIALAELAAEGPGALIVQPEVVECRGVSIRSVMTGGRVMATTRRTAEPGEWRSNVSGGASQQAVRLSGEERAMVEGAATALGLGHAGIDLLRTDEGPRILEVNACPDFTSMRPHVEVDLAEAVLLASL